MHAVHALDSEIYINLILGIIFKCFLQKKIFISYQDEKTSLKEVVELFDSIGYEPQSQILITVKKKTKKGTEIFIKDRNCSFVPNIMLLSS